MTVDTMHTTLLHNALNSRGLRVVTQHTTPDTAVVTAELADGRIVETWDIHGETATRRTDDTNDTRARLWAIIAGAVAVTRITPVTVYVAREGRGHASVGLRTVDDVTVWGLHLGCPESTVKEFPDEVGQWRRCTETEHLTGGSRIEVSCTEHIYPPTADA